MPDTELAYQPFAVAEAAHTPRGRPLPAFSIFIPAYNAGRHLAGVIARIPQDLREAVRSVWIVNDGSTDDTAVVAERIAASWRKVRSVTFARNRGYGAAVKAGLARVRSEPVAAAVCLHADGQYAPEAMPELLGALRARGLDLVQGSRIASGTALSGGMPLYKYLAGRVLTTIENLAFRMKMTDYHSGYLCYGRRALDAIPFGALSDSFDFDLEAIAAARALGLRVGEVPVPTHYGDEVSHLSPVTYGLRALRVVARYLAGRYGKACHRAHRGTPRTARRPTSVVLLQSAAPTAAERCRHCCRPSQKGLSRASAPPRRWSAALYWPLPSAWPSCRSRLSSVPSVAKSLHSGDDMILVTGGAGVMGSRLVRRLAEEGHRVRALVLPGDPFVRRLDGIGSDIATGDITDPGSLAPAMRGVKTVYHLAAVIVSKDPDVFRRVNLEGTRNVVAAAAGAGVGHFVYVSSASVTYPTPTNYSRSKKEAEEVVRGETRFRSTIVRPTLVYDARGGQEIEMFRAYLRRFPVVPFIGKGRALKRPVFAGDIIDGLARIAGNEKTFGRTYNFSGGEAISMMELARLLVRQMGVRRVIVPVPEFLWRAAAGVLGLVIGSGAFARQIIAGFTQDADLDPSEAMRDLGYDPLPATVGIPRHFHRGV